MEDGHSRRKPIVKHNGEERGGSRSLGGTHGSVTSTGLHLGRRTPKGGRNFSTTGPTALIAAHGQGLTPTVKSAAPVIHPRKVRLIDILLPPASSGLWRAPRLLFTRSERRQHETPPYLGLVRGPTSLVLLGEKLVLTQPARNSGTTRSPLSSLPRHRPRPEKSSE